MNYAKESKFINDSPHILNATHKNGWSLNKAEDYEAITFEQIRDFIEKVQDKAKDKDQQARDSK